MKEVQLLKLEDIKQLSADNLAKLYKALSLCMFDKSKAAITTKVNLYLSYNNKELLPIYQGSEIIGVVGTLLNKDKLTITHLAILKDYQKQGIATKIVNALPIKYQVNKIEAETDRESVEFYRKQGFMITKVKDSKFERYHCLKHLELF